MKLPPKKWLLWPVAIIVACIVFPIELWREGKDAIKWAWRESFGRIREEIAVFLKADDE